MAYSIAVQYLKTTTTKNNKTPQTTRLNITLAMGNLRCHWTLIYTEAAEEHLDRVRKHVRSMFCFEDWVYKERLRIERNNFRRKTVRKVGKVVDTVRALHNAEGKHTSETWGGLASVVQYEVSKGYVQKWGFILTILFKVEFSFWESLGWDFWDVQM